MKIENRKHSGFTLIEIMVTVGVIGLLAGIAIPNFLSARSSSNKSTCIANLKQLSDAKTTWAMENGKKTSDEPDDSDLFGTDRYLRARPSCPSGGHYLLESVQVRTSCTLATVEGHSL